MSFLVGGSCLEEGLTAVGARRLLLLLLCALRAAAVPSTVSSLVLRLLAPVARLGPEEPGVFAAASLVSAGVATGGGGWPLG